MKFWIQTVSCVLLTMSSLHEKWKMMLYDVKNYFYSFSFLLSLSTQNIHIIAKCCRAWILSRDDFTISKWFRTEYNKVSPTRECRIFHILRINIMFIATQKMCQNKHQQVRWGREKCAEREDGIAPRHNALAMMWWVSKWKIFHRLKLKLKQLVNKKAAEWHRMFLWAWAARYKKVFSRQYVHKRFEWFEYCWNAQWRNT